MFRQIPEPISPYRSATHRRLGTVRRVTEPSRRSVLFMLGGGLLSTTLGGSVLSRASRATASRPGPSLAALRSANLHRSRFLPGVGSAFSARSDQGSFRVRLVEIRDLAHSPAEDAEHSFNLMFRPVGRPAPEGIYQIDSAATGPATLFLSPVGPGVPLPGFEADHAG